MNGDEFAVSYPKCDRCKDPMKSSIMSRFNTQQICENCEQKEKAHPKYAEAKAAEFEACKNGNRNFKGIGLPSDLFVKN